ncbi:MAG: thiamine diphosphokinase [Acidimicrobiia bacterium]
MDDSTERQPPALILASAEMPEPLPDVGNVTYVVAADGGLRHAVRLGVVPDVIVGDIDSADPDQLADAVATGAAVERHPADKDMTDWELALRHVRDAGYRTVVVVGGGGGRLDHLLANALSLASDEHSGLDVVWHVGTASVRVARRSSPVAVIGSPGETVTLLAIGGDATGVTTEGLRWKLTDGSLTPGSGLGISNELVAERATVSVNEGSLLVIQERSRA